MWPSALGQAAHRDATVDGNDRPRSLLTLLAEPEAVAAEIAARPPEDLDGHAAAEALVRAHRAVDRVRAVQLGWLGRVESEGAWLGTGARSIGAWVGRALDVPFHEARRLVRTARMWRDVVHRTAAAARAGEVSTAKGSLIAATATTPARVDALLTQLPAADADAADREGTGADSTAGSGPDAQEGGAAGRSGEDVLLHLARNHGVNEFRALARRFSHVTDPDADERGYREALEREHFDLAATTGGYHLSGFLTTDHGQVLKTALRAVDGVPAAGDTRTSSQRRAAALTNLGQLVLDKGLTGKVGTVRPHLSVHVGFTELEDLLCENRHGHGTAAQDAPRLRALVTSPPAEWEDGAGPIPRTVLRRLAADCEITRVVFGPDSKVLDVGRTQRTFAGHLRRAVVARDRSCVIEDCGAPPSIGQVHHATTRWADGGQTDVAHSALVCGFHNQWLEDHRIPMRRRTGPDGRGRWQIGSPGTYQPGGGGHFPPARRDSPGAREGPDDIPLADSS